MNNTNTEWCQSMQHYTWHCWMTHTLILNETNQGDMTPSIVELHIQIQHKTKQSRMISSYTAWPISILNDASQCWTTKWQIYQYFSDFFFILKSFHLCVVVSVLICTLLSIGGDMLFWMMIMTNCQIISFYTFICIKILWYI